MKSILPQFLSLCAALAVLGKTNSAQQDLLVGEDGMVRKDRVSGHNDAVYDIVPKEDQIWKIEFLEIAPTPIIADRAFFVYLGGYLPESKKKELALPDEGLVNATLTVSLSAVYADGSYADETSYTVPLKTTPFGDLAHLGIRDSRGVQVEYMPSSDDGDILVDFQILHIGVFEERYVDLQGRRKARRYRQYVPICYVVDTMVRWEAPLNSMFGIIDKLNGSTFL